MRKCPYCGLPSLANSGVPGYRYGVGDFETWICGECQYVAEFKIVKKKKQVVVVKEERDYDW